MLDNAGNAKDSTLGQNVGETDATVKPVPKNGVKPLRTIVNDPNEDSHQDDNYSSTDKAPPRPVKRSHPTVATTSKSLSIRNQADDGVLKKVTKPLLSIFNNPELDLEESSTVNDSTDNCRKPVKRIKAFDSVVKVSKPLSTISSKSEISSAVNDSIELVDTENKADCLVIEKPEHKCSSTAEIDDVVVVYSGERGGPVRQNQNCMLEHLSSKRIQTVDGVLKHLSKPLLKSLFSHHDQILPHDSLKEISSCSINSENMEDDGDIRVLKVVSGTLKKTSKSLFKIVSDPSPQDYESSLPNNDDLFDNSCVSKCDKPREEIVILGHATVDIPSDYDNSMDVAVKPLAVDISQYFTKYGEEDNEEDGEEDSEEDETRTSPAGRPACRPDVESSGFTSEHSFRSSCGSDESFDEEADRLEAEIEVKAERFGEGRVAKRATEMVKELLEDPGIVHEVVQEDETSEIGEENLSELAEGGNNLEDAVVYSAPDNSSKGEAGDVAVADHSEDEQLDTDDELDLDHIEEISRYECLLCGQIFATQSTLRQHVRGHIFEFVPSETSSESTRTNVNISTKYAGDSPEVVTDDKHGEELLVDAADIISEQQSDGEKNHELKCSTCERTTTYLTVKSLKSHNKMHSHCKGISCKICGNYYLEEAGLLKHIKESYHDCKICGKYFLKKVELREHVNFIHLKITFDCKICDKSYQTNKSLREHVSGDHFGTKRKPTVIKPRVVVTRLSSNVNLGDMRKSLHWAKRNLVKNHKNTKAEYSVQDLPEKRRRREPQRFVSEIPKSKLQKAETGAAENKNLGKRYITDNAEQVNQRVKRKCRNTARYEDEGEYGEEDELPEEIETYTVSKYFNDVRETRTQLKCLKCSKMFMTAGSLRRHCSRFHAVLPIYIPGSVFNKEIKLPIKCHRCFAGFSRVSELKQHLVETHLEITDNSRFRYLKKWLCSDCDLMFVSENLLKKHRKSHKDDTYWMCMQCQKKIYGLVNLHQHLLFHRCMTKHNGQKQPDMIQVTEDNETNVYPCSICFGLFLSQESQTAHELSEHFPDNAGAEDVFIRDVQVKTECNVPELIQSDVFNDDLVKIEEVDLLAGEEEVPDMMMPDLNSSESEYSASIMPCPYCAEFGGYNTFTREGLTEHLKNCGLFTAQKLYDLRVCPFCIPFGASSKKEQPTYTCDGLIKHIKTCKEFAVSFPNSCGAMSKQGAERIPTRNLRSCPYCPKSKRELKIFTEDGLINHLKTCSSIAILKLQSDQGQPLLACPYCGIIFDNPGKLLNHCQQCLKYWKGVVHWFCPYCRKDETFGSLKNIEQHCDGCQHLLQHQRKTLHNQIFQAYPPITMKETVNLTMRKADNVNLTNGHKIYTKCRECEELFSRTEDLAAHQKTHDVEISWTCVPCSRKLRGVKNLHKHLLFHKCLVKYKDKRHRPSSKGRHVRMPMVVQHTGVHQAPVYPCPICFQLFTSTELRRSHEGEEHQPVIDIKGEKLSSPFEFPQSTVYKVWEPTHAVPGPVITETCQDDIQILSETKAPLAGEYDSFALNKCSVPSNLIGPKTLGGFKEHQTDVNNDSVVQTHLITRCKLMLCSNRECTAVRHHTGIRMKCPYCASFGGSGTFTLGALITHLKSCGPFSECYTTQKLSASAAIHRVCPFCAPFNKASEDTPTFTSDGLIKHLEMCEAFADQSADKLLALPYPSPNAISIAPTQLVLDGTRECQTKQTHPDHTIIMPMNKDQMSAASENTTGSKMLQKNLKEDVMLESDKGSKSVSDIMDASVMVNTDQIMLTELKDKTSSEMLQNNIEDGYMMSDSGKDVFEFEISEKAPMLLKVIVCPYCSTRSFENHDNLIKHLMVCKLFKKELRLTEKKSPHHINCPYCFLEGYSMTSSTFSLHLKSCEPFFKFLSEDYSFCRYCKKRGAFKSQKSFQQHYNNCDEYKEDFLKTSFERLAKQNKDLAFCPYCRHTFIFNTPEGVRDHCATCNKFVMFCLKNKIDTTVKDDNLEVGPSKPFEDVPELVTSDVFKEEIKTKPDFKSEVQAWLTEPLVDLMLPVMTNEPGSVAEFNDQTPPFIDEQVTTNTSYHSGEVNAYQNNHRLKISNVIRSADSANPIKVGGCKVLLPKCLLCDLVFSDDASLEEHNSSYHREMFTCIICKEVFISEEDIGDHMVLHDSVQASPPAHADHTNSFSELMVPDIFKDEIKTEEEIKIEAEIKTEEGEDCMYNIVDMSAAPTATPSVGSCWKVVTPLAEQEIVTEKVPSLKTKQSRAVATPQEQETDSNLGTVKNKKKRTSKKPSRYQCDVAGTEEPDSLISDTSEQPIEKFCRFCYKHLFFFSEERYQGHVTRCESGLLDGRGSKFKEDQRRIKELKHSSKSRKIVAAQQTFPGTPGPPSQKKRKRSSQKPARYRETDVEKSDETEAASSSASGYRLTDDDLAKGRQTATPDQLSDVSPPSESSDEHAAVKDQYCSTCSKSFFLSSFTSFQKHRRDCERSSRPKRSKTGKRTVHKAAEAYIEVAKKVDTVNKRHEITNAQLHPTPSDVGLHSNEEPLVEQHCPFCSIHITTSADRFQKHIRICRSRAWRKTSREKSQCKDPSKEPAATTPVVSTQISFNDSVTTGVGTQKIKESPVGCPYCGVIYSSSTFLKKHYEHCPQYKKHHLNTQIAQNVPKHVARSSTVNPVQTSDTLIRSLSNAVVNMSAVLSQSVVCPYCNVVSSSPERVRKHYQECDKYHQYISKHDGKHLPEHIYMGTNARYVTIEPIAASPKLTLKPKPAPLPPRPKAPPNPSDIFPFDMDF